MNEILTKYYNLNELLNLLDFHGFYKGILYQHDRESIVHSFENNEVIVLMKRNKTIGFTTWKGEKQWIKFLFKWILPEYRAKGIGRRFSELIFEELIRRKVFLVLAEPATPHGHGMANSLGLRPLSETDYRFYPKLYYLFLIRDRTQIQISGSGYELLIWHDWNNQSMPAKIYRINETMAKKPIITIINRDAWVELHKNGTIIKKDNCKYFFKDKLQSYGLLYLNRNLSSLLKELNLG